MSSTNKCAIYNDLLPGESLVEVNNKWGSTLCRYKGSPVYIESIITLPNKTLGIKGAMVLNQEWVPKTLSLDNENFVFEWPDLGYRNNISNDAVLSASYLVRIPARQWKKGVHAPNIVSQRVEIELTQHFITRSPFASQLRNHMVSAWNEVFNPSFLSMTEVVKGISNLKIISAALSPSLAVAATLRYKYPVLLYEDSEVGLIEPGRFIHLAPEADAIEPELSTISNLQVRYDL